MISFWRCTKAEYMKLRKTPFFLIHIAVPVIIGTAFLLYARVTNYGETNMYLSFVQIISIAYPIVIALLCNMSAKMEAEAGSYYFLLCATKRRWIPLASKLALLLICGLGACLLASCAITLAGKTVFSQTDTAAIHSLPIALVLWSANVILYLWHIILSFHFGRDINLSAGVIEFLLAALLSTKIGDKIWAYMPSSYGVRFGSMYIIRLTTSDEVLLNEINHQMQYGLPAASALLITSLVALFFWINRWEGGKYELESSS